MARHFLSILDLSQKEAWSIVKRAKEMKESNFISDGLQDKTIVLLFEKASTRTRISFEVAITHLRGKCLFMTPAESQLGRSEPLKDTSRVISRYAQGMVVRTYGQEKVEELAAYASVPVINALTDAYHPCQVMSDMLTIYERTPDIDQLSIAWVGDGNNMAHSWINAAAHFSFSLRLACPKGYKPNKDILDRARTAGADITVYEDPVIAVQGVHYINTDVFASMGQEEEQSQRMEAFSGFQVNDELLSYADKQVKVMHCLPAHRGEEISESVMEGKHAVVWDQAENRLHMQKALLEFFIVSS